MIDAQAIRAAREGRKLTQRDVADACGVVELTVWRWEHSPPRDLTTRTARALCAVLGLTEDDLYTDPTPSATSPAKGSANGAK